MRRAARTCSGALAAAILAGHPAAAQRPATASRVAPATLMQPGISRELAEQRAATLSGVRYDLWLDLTQRDSAAGIVRMQFTRAAGAGDLVADFRGERLAEVRVN